MRRDETLDRLNAEHTAFVLAHGRTGGLISMDGERLTYAGVGSLANPRLSIDWERLCERAPDAYRLACHSATELGAIHKETLPRGELWQYLWTECAFWFSTSTKKRRPIYDIDISARRFERIIEWSNLRLARPTFRAGLYAVYFSHGLLGRPPVIATRDWMWRMDAERARNGDDSRAG